MGGKASNNFQQDRPESGGADKDMRLEKSGVLEREKEQFAVDAAEKQAADARSQRARAKEDQPDSPSEFSIDNPRNPDPAK